jgi:hypothetical protein
MPLPSSGPLGIGAIRTELGSSSGSLRTLSSLAGFSTPDAISEFYGYGGLPSGLVAGYNQGSYPGSGIKWNDMSGNDRHMTLVNPIWDSSWSFFYTKGNTDFLIPGSTALYNNFTDSNFTWIIRAGWDGETYQDLTGLFWSEDFGKNFLTGIYYPHTGSNFVPRVDSCCTTRASWNFGEPASNTGESPSQANFDWRDNFCDYFPMIIIRGESTASGMVVSFYGMNQTNHTTPIYLWQSNPFTDWGIGNTSQAIHVMCRSTGNYYAIAKLACVYMWGRYLSNAECKQVYDFDYPISYAC